MIDRELSAAVVRHVWRDGGATPGRHPELDDDAIAALRALRALPSWEWR